jgi:hypothetical protein
MVKIKNWLIALMLALSSCLEPEPTIKERHMAAIKNEPIDTFKYASKLVVNLLIIDSCEYVVGYADGYDSRTFFLTHKGNCKNHKK